MLFFLNAFSSSNGSGLDTAAAGGGGRGGSAIAGPACCKYIVRLGPDIRFRMGLGWIVPHLGVGGGRGGSGIAGPACYKHIVKGGPDIRFRMGMGGRSWCWGRNFLYSEYFALKTM